MTRKPRQLGVLLIACVTLGASIALTASATNMARPPAQPTAVAVIDLVSVLDGLNEKTYLEGQLQAGLQSRQSQLDSVIKQIENARAALEVLNEGTAEYREKIREVIELSAVAEARRNVLQRIISVEKADMLRGIYAHINSGVQRIAERDGYDIVLLDDSKFPLPQGDVSDRDVERSILSRSVIHSHPSIDITAQVVTLLNNEYRAP